MKIYPVYIYLWLLFSFLSCTTYTNTKGSRFYHAFNTRYNGWYNANTLFDEAVKEREKVLSRKGKPFFSVYPVYVENEDSIDIRFDLVIQKTKKAIQIHSITTKPSKKPGWRKNPLYAKVEYNPFLKYCWFLLGKAQFYKGEFSEALDTFSTILMQYPLEKEIINEALLWKTLCYIYLDNLYGAIWELERVFPNPSCVLYHSIQIEYLIKSGKYKEAIPSLQVVIQREKNRFRRIRLKGLLEQLVYTVSLELEVNSGMVLQKIEENKPETVKIIDFISEIEKEQIQVEESILEKDVPHRLVFNYPVNEITTNRLLFTIAPYYFDYFPTRTYEPDIRVVGDIQFFSITGFKDWMECKGFCEKLEIEDMKGYIISEEEWNRKRNK